MQPYTVNFPVLGTAASGVLAAGTVVWGRVPASTAGGAVTVIEAMAAGKSGTCTVNIVDMGPAGTSVAGTIVALALAAAGATPLGTVLATTYKLDPGDYYGLEIGVGTVLTPFNVSMNFLPGVA